MSYETYKTMIDSYKNNDGRFEAAARNWIEDSEACPFDIKDARELFFNAKKYCRKWRNGGIDSRSSKRNMVECVRRIAEMNIGYPYELIEKEKEEAKDREYKKQLEQKQKTEEQKKKEEELKKEQDQRLNDQENAEDAKYVLYRMADAYNANNDVNFKQFAVHLMEITLENPFAEETPEFYKFEEMKEVYLKHNMRRLHVLAGELCQIINYTEIEPEKIKLEEPKKVLGVPDEKHSWFKFLHPWR